VFASEAAVIELAITKDTPARVLFLFCLFFRVSSRGQTRDSRQYVPSLLVKADVEEKARHNVTACNSSKLPSASHF
jgi:hypothetical protein